MEAADIVARFVVRPPLEILIRLARHFRTHPGVRPWIDVGTAEGVVHSGRLVDVDEREGAALLHASENHGGDVVYLRLDRVTSLKVRGAEELGALLSEGRVARAPGEEAPTRLLVRRTLAGLRAAGLAVDAVWEAVPEAAEALLNLRDLAEAVTRAAAAVARDKEGRKALEEYRAICIRHEAGTRLRARPKGRTLLMEADLTRALPEKLAEEAESAMNAAL